MTTMKLLAGILVAAALAGGKFTESELGALFYYDLGPYEVDVSDYPTQQRFNYRIFRITCSQCHTLARPINSPYTSEKDWENFIKRMHVKTHSRRDAWIAKKDVESILSFLVYDAKKRKIDDKKAFDKQTEKLKARFEEVLTERGRMQVEKDKVKAREMRMYVNETPRAY